MPTTMFKQEIKIYIFIILIFIFSYPFKGRAQINDEFIQNRPHLSQYKYYPANPVLLQYFNEIVDSLKIKDNYKILEANIPFAGMSFKSADSIRYILLNHKKIQKLDINGKDKWLVVMILGHELGHFYNKDFNQKESSIEKELKADKFAGYVLYKMGASVEDILKLDKYLNDKNIPVVLNDDIKILYPKKKYRLQAIQAGWYEGRFERLINKNYSIEYEQGGILLPDYFKITRDAKLKFKHISASISTQNNEKGISVKGLIETKSLIGKEIVIKVHIFNKNKDYMLKKIYQVKREGKSTMEIFISLNEIDIKVRYCLHNFKLMLVAKINNTELSRSKLLKLKKLY